MKTNMNEKLAGLLAQLPTLTPGDRRLHTCTEGRGSCPACGRLRFLVLRRAGRAETAWLTAHRAALPKFHAVKQAKVAAIALVVRQ